MRYTIVGLGDSITEATVQMSEADKRWLNVLKRKLEDAFPDHEFNVINSGVGGNSDREKMLRFERDVLAHDPDFVLAEFGGNNTDPNRPERRVSLTEARESLEKLKAKLPEKTRIIVITFPPLIEHQHSYYGHEFFETNGGMEKSLELYREISRDFAARHNLPLVDFAEELKAKMNKDGDNVYVLTDGVHLTAAGNLELADLVFLKLNDEIVNKENLK